jgi:(E)-4-hydroxy-3-methylbut-2-enyl-diphosphate synthase
VYVDGRLMTTLKGDRIVAEFLVILEEYVASHYSADRADAGRHTAIGA